MEKKGHDTLLTTLEGRLEGKWGRGRPRRTWVDDTGVAMIFVWGGHPADSTQPCISRGHVWSCRGQLNICERSSSQQNHGWSPQSKIKIATKYRWNDIWGRISVNVVSLRYIGMIYLHVGEMCFILMNVHNELFNSVHMRLSLSVVPHPVFQISGISLRFGDVAVSFLQSNVLCS